MAREKKNVEMVFEKTEKVKESFSRWNDNIVVRETKKFYRVTVPIGTNVESILKKCPEYVTSRNF